MHAPRTVIGIEQIDDRVVVHHKRDLRPVMANLAWAGLMAIVLLVVGSCDDNNGMYQGPNDDAPKYGAPR